MHPTTHNRWPRLFAGLILVAGLAGAAAHRQPAAAQPPKDATVGDVKIDLKTGALVVPVGGLVRFDPKLGKDVITDIVVTNENVLSVRPDPANPGILLLTGRSPGLSRMTIVLKDKPKLDYDVIVQPDLELLRLLIRKTVPTANVDVTAGVGNVIVLSGYVTSPQDAVIITRMAISQTGQTENNVINAMQVGGVQQVQIDVVIATVQRNELRQRGFDFSINGSTVK